MRRRISATVGGITYDANGNTLSYNPDGVGNRVFTYDPENRPLSLTLNSNTTSFTYDPEGERASKTEAPPHHLSGRRCRMAGGCSRAPQGC